MVENAFETLLISYKEALVLMKREGIPFKGNESGNY